MKNLETVENQLKTQGKQIIIKTKAAVLPLHPVARLKHYCMRTAVFKCINLSFFSVLISYFTAVVASNLIMDLKKDL